MDQWRNNRSFDRRDANISGGTAETRYTWYTASLQAYPLASRFFRGAYLRGAFGIADYSSTVVYDTLFAANQFAVNQERRFTAKDLGGSVGIGIDIPIIRSATVGAYTNYFFAMRADYKGPGGSSGQRIGARMFAYGVALTVR